jgi:hypothetical protein
MRLATDARLPQTFAFLVRPAVVSDLRRSATLPAVASVARRYRLVHSLIWKRLPPKRSRLPRHLRSPWPIAGGCRLGTKSNNARWFSNLVSELQAKALGNWAYGANIYASAKRVIRGKC